MGRWGWVVDIGLGSSIGERAIGHASGEAGLYRSLNSGNRDLACLLLADLSLSTDTWINNDMRVIDVIRDSVFLFAESLAATGDPFALYGFSSTCTWPDTT